VTQAEIAFHRAQGYAVLIFDAFLTGDRADATALAQRKQPFDVFFSTYNRTNLQERVQDIITVCAYLRSRADISHILLAGGNGAGLWAALAAPSADALTLDASNLDLTTDAALLEEDNYVPGLRRMGDIATALALAAPNPVTIYNAGTKFAGSEQVAELYRALGVSDRFTIRAGERQ
jgi:hypothetical protein